MNRGRDSSPLSNTTDLSADRLSVTLPMPTAWMKLLL